MKRHFILLMAALSLIISASAKTPTGIPITSLPFTITAPGTCVLESDLSFSAPSGDTSTYPGIIIATNIPGPVILNLNGHTISGSNGVCVGIGIGLWAGYAGGNHYSSVVFNNVGETLLVESAAAHTTLQDYQESAPGH